MPTLLQLEEAVDGIKARLTKTEEDCQNIWEKLEGLQKELQEVKLMIVEQGPARRQIVVLKRRVEEIKKEVDSLNLTRASTKWPINLWEKALLIAFGAAVMFALAKIFGFAAGG